MYNTGAYLSAGVTATATPTDAFNVNSAASTGNTTATVTFSAAPVTSEAQTSGNYKIVAGAGSAPTHRSHRAAPYSQAAS